MIDVADSRHQAGPRLRHPHPVRISARRRKHRRPLRPVPRHRAPAVARRAAAHHRRRRLAAAGGGSSKRDAAAGGGAARPAATLTRHARARTRTGAAGDRDQRRRVHALPDADLPRGRHPPDRLEEADAGEPAHAPGERRSSSQSFGEYYRYVVLRPGGDGPPARRRLDQRDLVLPQPQALLVREGHAVPGVDRRGRSRPPPQAASPPGAPPRRAARSRFRWPWCCSTACPAGTSTSWRPICRRACWNGRRRPPGRSRRSGDIPPRYLKRYMLRGMGAQAGKMKAGPDIRDVVTFRRMNLNDDMWSLEPLRAVRRRVLPQRPHVLRAGPPRARAAQDRHGACRRAAICSSATPRG